MQSLSQSSLIGLLSALLMACSSPQAPKSQYPYPLTYDVAAVKLGEKSPLNSYDDFTLRRNWAFASCIAKTFNDNQAVREDAYSAAGGYFNAGSGLDIYSHLAELAEQYLSGTPYFTLENKKEIKLLKCIDFFHSAELRDMLILEKQLSAQFKTIRENPHRDNNGLRQQLSEYNLREKGPALSHALYLIEFALEHEQLDLIQLLLDLGVNPDKETLGYGSPLELAFTQQDARYLKAMLDGGLSPNHNYLGQEPMLHRAIASGSLKQVQLLVQRGTDINAKNSQGISALSAAIKSGKTDIAQYLIEQGAAQ